MKNSTAKQHSLIVFFYLSERSTFREITDLFKVETFCYQEKHRSENICNSPLEAAVNVLRSSSMPENLRFSSPTRWREPLLSARSSTLCTVLFTVYSTAMHCIHTLYMHICHCWRLMVFSAHASLGLFTYTVLFPEVLQHCRLNISNGGTLVRLG